MNGAINLVYVWMNDAVNDRASCLSLSMSACPIVVICEFFCVYGLLGVLVLMSG